MIDSRCDARHALLALARRLVEAGFDLTPISILQNLMVESGKTSAWGRSSAL
jgi:hypothetical protein